MSGKRVRESQAEAESENECPVCFNPMGVGGPHTIARPFECSHALCRRCDHRMFQGHDDRCPTCRAARGGASLAESGDRPPGTPVHLRRPEPVEGTIAEMGGFFFANDDEGGIHYTSVITAPGGDQVFASLEEMLSTGRGISRSGTITRIRGANAPALAHALRAFAGFLGTGGERPAIRQAEQAITQTMNAISDDPQLSAAIDGLNNPTDVSLGTFLQRVRGSNPAAQAQAGRTRGNAPGSTRRRLMQRMSSSDR